MEIRAGQPKEAPGGEGRGSKLLSEIRQERIREGSLRILRTNYYVEGLLRKPLKLKVSKEVPEAPEDPE